MKVVPIFHTPDGMWSVAEPRGMHVRARSLRALQRKLPDGAVIEGYYPQGCPPDVLQRLTAPPLAQTAENGRAAIRKADAKYEHLKAELRAAGKIL